MKTISLPEKGRIVPETLQVVTYDLPTARGLYDELLIVCVRRN